MIDLPGFAERYVAVWNEPDAEVRRTTIARLWTEDAVQYLEPPEQVREAAAALAVTPSMTSRGHEALEARVTRAYEEFVAPGEYVFRPCTDVVRLNDVVKFSWEMVPVDGGPAAGGGLQVVVLDQDDRIRADYQFIG